MKINTRSLHLVKVLLISAVLAFVLSFAVIVFLSSDRLPKTIESAPFPVSVLYDRDCYADDTLPSSGTVACYQGYRLDTDRTTDLWRVTVYINLAAVLLSFVIGIVYAVHRYKLKKP